MRLIDPPHGCEIVVGSATGWVVVGFLLWNVEPGSAAFSALILACPAWLLLTLFLAGPREPWWPEAKPPAPALATEGVAAIEALAGRHRWSTATTLDHGFQRAGRDGALHAWLAELPPGYAALTLVLWTPPGSTRDGPRIIHAARDDAARVLPRGLREPIEALLAACDEVRLVGPRLEARVRRPADARALLERPGGLEALAAGLETLPAAAEGSPAGPGPTANESCPYCHDPLAVVASSACAACGTRHHVECLDEHGGCTVSGCRDAPERARLTA